MSIAQRLRDGERVVGTMIRVVVTPAIAPLAVEAGLDFIMVDLEHGTAGVQAVSDLAIAAGGVGLPIFVRVPELSRGWVSRVLDAGAVGVMVPMTESADQARQIVQWAKYPPLGGRGLSSFGPNTGYRHLGDAGQLMADANRDVLTIAQIESAAGVAAAADIAAVEGIDALLIGPHDLSVSLGHPGQVDTPDQDAAVARVDSAAEKASKAFGLHAGNAAHLARHMDKGLRLIMCGHDVGVIASGLQRLAEQMRSLPAD